MEISQRIRFSSDQSNYQELLADEVIGTLAKNVLRMYKKKAIVEIYLVIVYEYLKLLLLSFMSKLDLHSIN